MRRLTGVVVALVAATISLTGCGAAESIVHKAKPGPTRLQKVHKQCDSSSTSDLSIADKGHTLIIDTKSEHDTNGFIAYVCITTGLKTPKSVTSQIEQSTAMMGEQSADGDGLHYVFSYHPDNGLYVQITDGKQ